MADAGYAWASDLADTMASFTVTVQSGVEDSGYTADHLTDWTTPDIWHQPAKLTGSSGAWLLTSTGSPVADVKLELAVLWLHNVAQSVSVSLQGNDSNAWNAPSFSKAFTIPAAWADGRRVPVFLDLRNTTAATSGYAYYRLVIGSNSAAPAAKLLLASSLYTISGYLLAGARFGHEFKADVLTTDLGFVAGELLHQVRMRTFAADVVPESLVALQTLEAWYLDTLGGKPVVWIPNVLVSDAWVARFTKPITPTPVSSEAWRISLELEELAPGAPL